MARVALCAAQAVHACGVSLHGVVRLLHLTVTLNTVVWQEAGARECLPVQGIETVQNITTRVVLGSMYW